MRCARMVLILTPFILFPLILMSSSAESSGQDGSVLLVELSGFISSASAEHVASAIQFASPSRHSAILITLDTFGGSMDAMFRIIENIQSSNVPVIGYVHPPGRQALSAGTVILMATDVAAMAPYTTIGSAQPVFGGEPITDAKTINALVEKTVAVARLHGRNETQAARFITQNDNLLPEEAVELHVIEEVAGSPQELLSAIHGHRVTTLSGARVLETSGAVLEKFQPSPRVVILGILADPLISGILIGVGFLALILGLTSPGWGAEVAGVVALLLGLAGQGFNVNYTAIALLALGSALIVFEIYSPGFGLAGIGGIGVLGLGMALLITQPVLPSLLAASYLTSFAIGMVLVLAVTGVFFALVIYKAAKAIKLKRMVLAQPSGEGRAVDPLGPELVGYVVVSGEYWMAKSRVLIEKGSNVKVVGAEGKTLLVEPS